MDLELRHLRYFVAVAEELHFTRAAERLHMGQPALSARIAALERTVGCRLLARTTRHVELTPAGEAFLERARGALREADAALADARRAARGEERTLRVGFVGTGAAELTPLILQAFAERHPEVELDAIRFDVTDVSGGLRTGETDVAFLVEPVDHPDIETELLLEEPRVFLLPDWHELASRDELAAEDVADWPAVEITGAESDPLQRRWLDSWALTPRPDGMHREVGAYVRNTDEWLTAVAAGKGITSSSSAVGRFWSRPGIVVVPSRGLPPARHVVAWRKDADDPLVDAFVQEALRISAASPRPVPG